MSLTLTIPPLHFHCQALSYPHPIKPLYLSSHAQILHNWRSYSTGKPRKSSRKISDAELASDFAAQVDKMNTQLKDQQTALNKSKQLLFSDFCTFLNMSSDDVKVQWRKMSFDEKLGLVQGFVSDWGLNFHPLSPKSVRDLLEEFVMENSVKEMDSSGVKKDYYDDFGVIFPKLKKLFMG